ncbi:MAG: GNAT family N-acetyltransferase [Candidatus Woesearchaeota archaeon]
MSKIETLRQVYQIARNNFSFSFVVIIAALIGSLYVIKHRKTVVAFAIRMRSYLSYIAVKDDVQGKGYGKRLLEKLAPCVRSLHVKTTEQKVISLYKRYGFSILKKTRLPTGERYLMVKTDS